MQDIINLRVSENMLREGSGEQQKHYNFGARTGRKEFSYRMKTTRPRERMLYFSMERSERTRNIVPGGVTKLGKNVTKHDQVILTRTSGDQSIIRRCGVQHSRVSIRCVRSHSGRFARMSWRTLGRFKRLKTVCGRVTATVMKLMVHAMRFAYRKI